MIFVGLTPTFLREKVGPEKFCSPKGGPETFLHQAPLTSVCERSLITENVRFSSWAVLYSFLNKEYSLFSMPSLSYNKNMYK